MPIPREVPQTDSHPSGPAAVSRLLQRLGVPPGVSILDFPSGSGYLTWQLVQAGYGVTPADIAPEVYQLSFPRCVAANLDATFPFPDNRFDVAICCEGLPASEHPASAFREFARVIKPQGFLIVVFPNITNLFSRCRFLLTGFYNKFPRPLDELKGEPNTHPLAFPYVRYLLRRSGFQILAVTTNRYKPSHWSPLPLAPLIWIMTGLVFLQKCRRPSLREIRWGIFKQLTSLPLLFGEAVVLLVQKPEIN